LFALGGRDARAGVGHCHGHLVVCVHHRHAHLAVVLVVPDGVGQPFGQSLTQPRGIGKHGRQQVEQRRSGRVVV